MAQGRYTGVSTRAGLKQVVYLSKRVVIREGYALGNWNTSNPVVHLTTRNARGRVLVIVGSVTPIIKGPVASPAAMRPARGAISGEMTAAGCTSPPPK